MFLNVASYFRVANPQLNVIVDLLLSLQMKDGDDAGSWSRSVLSTSMYLMSLEVYYRFLPVNR